MIVMKTLNTIFVLYVVFVIAMATVNITAIWWLVVPVGLAYLITKLIEKKLK